MLVEDHLLACRNQIKEEKYQDIDIAGHVSSKYQLPTQNRPHFSRNTSALPKITHYSHPSTKIKKKSIGKNKYQ